MKTSHLTSSSSPPSTAHFAEARRSDSKPATHAPIHRWSEALQRVPSSSDVDRILIEIGKQDIPDMLDLALAIPSITADRIVALLSTYEIRTRHRGFLLNLVAQNPISNASSATQDEFDLIRGLTDAIKRATSTTHWSESFSRMGRTRVRSTAGIDLIGDVNGYYDSLRATKQIVSPRVNLLTPSGRANHSAAVQYAVDILERRQLDRTVLYSAEKVREQLRKQLTKSPLRAGRTEESGEERIKKAIDRRPDLGALMNGAAPISRGELSEMIRLLNARYRVDLKISDFRTATTASLPAISKMVSDAIERQLNEEVTTSIKMRGHRAARISTDPDPDYVLVHREEAVESIDPQNQLYAFPDVSGYSLDLGARHLLWPRQANQTTTYFCYDLGAGLQRIGYDSRQEYMIFHQYLLIEDRSSSTPSVELRDAYFGIVCSFEGELEYVQDRSRSLVVIRDPSGGLSLLTLGKFGEIRSVPMEGSSCAVARQYDDLGVIVLVTGFEDRDVYRITIKDGVKTVYESAGYREAPSIGVENSLVVVTASSSSPGDHDGYFDVRTQRFTELVGLRWSQRSRTDAALCTTDSGEYALVNVQSGYCASFPKAIRGYPYEVRGASDGNVTMIVDCSPRGGRYALAVSSTVKSSFIRSTRHAVIAGSEDPKILTYEDRDQFGVLVLEARSWREVPTPGPVENVLPMDGQTLLISFRDPKARTDFRYDILDRSGTTRPMVEEDLSTVRRFLAAHRFGSDGYTTPGFRALFRLVGSIKGDIAKTFLDPDSKAAALHLVQEPDTGSGQSHWIVRDLNGRSVSDPMYGAHKFSETSGRTLSVATYHNGQLQITRANIPDERGFTYRVKLTASERLKLGLVRQLRGIDATDISRFQSTDQTITTATSTQADLLSQVSRTDPEILRDAIPAGCDASRYKGELKSYFVRIFPAIGAEDARLRREARKSFPPTNNVALSSRTRHSVEGGDPREEGVPIAHVNKPFRGFLVTSYLTTARNSAMWDAASLPRGGSAFGANGEVDHYTISISLNGQLPGCLALPMPPDGALNGDPRVRDVHGHWYQQGQYFGRTSSELPVIWFTKPETDVPLIVDYSFRVATGEEKLESISDEEYLRNLRGMRDAMDFLKPLGALPPDVQERVEAARHLPPLERAESLSRWWRSTLYYDMDYGEVGAAVSALPIYSRFAFCKSRFEGLRRRGIVPPATSPEVTRAVVCADAAILGVAMFRAAGLPSGVAGGFLVDGTAVLHSNAHLQPFILVPDRWGRFRAKVYEVTPLRGDDEARAEARHDQPIEAVERRYRGESSDQRATTRGRERGLRAPPIPAELNPTFRSSAKLRVAEITKVAQQLASLAPTAEECGHIVHALIGNRYAPPGMQLSVDAQIATFQGRAMIDLARDVAWYAEGMMAQLDQTSPTPAVARQRFYDLLQTLPAGVVRQPILRAIRSLAGKQS